MEIKPIKTFTDENGNWWIEFKSDEAKKMLEKINGSAPKDLIEFVKKETEEQLRIGGVSCQRGQLVCPSCDSHVIVSDERHNVKMCGVCKHQWAN